MQYYRTKDDIIAAIFLSLGINLIATHIDEGKKRVLFVFNISDVEGRALETLIKKNDPRIKVVAGVLHTHLEFVRSWLYLTRLRMRNTTFSDIEEITQNITPKVIDESPPPSYEELATEIMNLVSLTESEKDVV